MIHFLRRFYLLLSKRRLFKWSRIIALLGSLYIATIILMPYLEGSGSPFLSLFDSSWWFIVTVTTVGYGDMSPTSMGGKILAMMVMVGGIGSIALVIGNVSESIINAGRKKMKGSSRFNKKSHIVIFGYRGHETRQLIEEILADENRSKRMLVFCSSKAEENPFPDMDVDFIRGELTSDDVLERACVAYADKILIHGHDDHQTMAIAVAVFNINKEAHIVAYLASPDIARLLRGMNPKISCIEPFYVPMMVQEMQDPGVIDVIKLLFSNLVGEVIYRVDIPDGEYSVPFETLFKLFKEKYGATVIGVIDSGPIINPPSNFVVKAGMALVLIAAKRPTKVNWEEMCLRV